MTNLFKSFKIVIVEEGTEIEVPHPVTHQPETVIVVDGEAICKGREVFMTQGTYEKVKAEIESE